MCYSAQVWASYRRFVRELGAKIDYETFYELYFRRLLETVGKTPKAMDAAFSNPDNEQEARIKVLIDQFDAQQAPKYEQDLFKQRKRLADAERSLQSRSTIAALESRRIASDKVQWLLGKLADLRRTELRDEDSRIFPGHYVPVMVLEDGQRVVKPMRYQCRPAGKPASYDRKYPGTYNARRDNLNGFWRELFGFSHGVMVVNAFYENVLQHRVEHRELAPGEAEANVVLEFRPRPTQDMLIACLWSRWIGQGGAVLHSFAAITDEPPEEVAAVGHDRCIVQIRPDHLDEWLAATTTPAERLQQILDERPAAFYEHRLAA